MRSGDPFERLFDSSEDFATDLIVLATRGRTGIKRLVIGNVAEKVVRHARWPVLILKPPEPQLNPRPCGQTETANE